MRLSPRYVIVTCFTNGTASERGDGGEFDVGEGGGRWSKTPIRGEGPKVWAVSSKRVDSRWPRIVQEDARAKTGRVKKDR